MVQGKEKEGKKVGKMENGTVPKDMQQKKVATKKRPLPREEGGGSKAEEPQPKKTNVLATLLAGMGTVPAVGPDTDEAREKRRQLRERGKGGGTVVLIPTTTNPSSGGEQLIGKEDEKCTTSGTSTMEFKAPLTGEALQEAIDKVIAQCRWHTPREVNRSFELDPEDIPVVESAEVKNQTDRLQGKEEVTYVDESSIPDSPLEEGSLKTFVPSLPPQKIPFLPPAAVKKDPPPPQPATTPKPAGKIEQESLIEYSTSSKSHEGGG